MLIHPGRTFSILSALALVLSAFVSPRSQTARPSLAPEHQVTLQVTAIDKAQNLIQVRAEDLKLTENGKARELTKFETINDAPMTVAIMIDVSISQERVLDAQKAAATSFINSVIRPDRDQVAVATFTNVLNLEQQPTNNLDLIRNAISRVRIVEPTGYYAGGVVIGTRRSTSANAQPGSTAIWNALLQTCDASAISSPLKRYAIVLLTDGFDNSSDAKLQTVIECLGKKHIAVYPIGAGDKSLEGVDKGSLRKLAEMTGGQAYFPAKNADFAADFDHIAKLLRNYYLVSYNSDSAKPVDKVHLELIDRNSKQTELLYGKFVSR